MGNILDINPSDFGLPPTSPSISPSDVTKTVASGNLGVSLPNPADDQNLFRKPLETGEVKLPSTFGPSTQYYDTEQIKKYNGSAEYAPTMNPLADNEKIMADNFSKWDALKTGLSGMIDNGIAAYSEYSNFWPRLTRSIYNLDSDLFKPTEAEQQTIAEGSRLVGVNNPIYYPEGVGQNDIFTRQFLASSLQNAGFTLGTMAGFATEAIVFKKLGNLSKLFELGAASKSAEVSSELGQSTKLFNLGTKEKALGETAEDMVRNGASSRLGKKSLYDNFLKVSGYLPIVGTLAETGQFVREANAARATMGAAAFTEAEISRIGAGGVARAFQELNFAASEASVEMGNTYADIYNDAIDAYKANNDNKDPDEALKQTYRQNALEGASADYGSNVAVLAIMNKISFGNMFRKFGIDGKVLNMINQEAGQFYALTKGTGEDAFFKTYKRKFFGALSDAKDINKLFGTGALVKEVGKDLSRGLLKVEVAEGLQENIQDGINFSLRKHYKDIYDGKVSTWGEDFKAAVESQHNKKGWATFLQGALTGLFVSPITGSMTRVSEALNESKEHRGQLQKVLDSLNELGSNPSKMLSEPVSNIKKQTMYNNAMTQAAQSGLRYEYFNNRSSAIIQQALYAKRTGTFDAFKTFLKSYGSEFDDTEFEQATGINVKEFGASSPAAFIDDLVGKLDRYGELYTKYNTQFGQYFSTESLQDDPRAKEKYAFSMGALQDAIHAVAFNEAKAEDGTIRAGDIARTISSKSKTIGQAATSTFNTITEHQLGEVQISILNNEIKTLEEAEGTKTKETLDLIELKKEELKHLEEWNKKAYKTSEQTLEDGETIEVTNPLDFSTLSEEEQKGLADTLAKFYEVKNKQNNIKAPVSFEEIKSVLQDINDYQKLSRDTQDYMKSVNLLSDPGNTIKLMHAFEDARVGAFARLMHDKYTELAGMSGIFEEYIKNNPKDMNELLKLARSPFTSMENTAKLYDHLKNINKMVDTYNKTAEEENAKRQQQREEELESIKKQLFNDLKAAPANIGLMTDDEVKQYISDYYNADYDENDNFLGTIERGYTDADGNEQVTHKITAQEIENFFKDKPGFNITNISGDDLRLFAKNYEQALYNKENGVVATPETIQEHSVILNEVKKLKNLEGKELIYQGKRGVLRRNEKGFYIELGAEPTTATSSRTTTKADIEKSILGSFAETTERVITSKGASNGKTLRTELVSKVSSDGEVITFKSKSSFVGEDTGVVKPHSMPIEEFKEKFYPMLTAEEIENFEEMLDFYEQQGWDNKIYFKELRVGTSKTQKNLVGQLNLDVMIGIGNEYGFKLTRRLSDTELATLEAESAEVKPAADTIELGNDSSTGATEFTWELNKETGQLEMVDSSNELTLNDLPGLELIGDNITEEEQTITGNNSNSQTINNHTFEYVTENTYKIDGREYIVNEDENNNLLGITYTDEDGNGVFLTVEEADKNPDSIVGRLMNVAKIARVQSNINVTQETLDEATKVLESITPAEPIRISRKSKGQVTKELVNVMVDAMPDDVADIFDKYINNKTRSQVNDTEIKTLSSWAEDAYSKLQKLDQTDDVINAIDYISKNIINPINKKYGEQIVTKPKRKATKSSKAKDKAANVSGQVITKGPKQSAEGISKEKGSGIINAVDNALNQIEKHRKEVAVKMEELLPTSNLFTAPDIEEVTNAAQLSLKDLNLPSKEKINKNPFDDDSSYEDFICNR